ncbi:MAG: ABC-type bacteriocin/lantibiotic exporter with double-glycine peptidase domain [Planctomycetota bacterium]|jgi:ABC-type bacteriocin/lantibiotic exporter with double-glycine peptidase domain
MSPANTSIQQKQAPAYSVARFLRPYVGRISLVFAIMLLGTFLGLLHPWFVQLLIDRVLLDAREDLLWSFAALLLGVALFRFAIGVLQAWVYALLTSRILLDMRTDFLQHLQTMSLRFFTNTRFGDIITRFNRDLSQLQEISTGALLGFVTSCLTLIGTVAWAVYYDWQLFLIAAIPFPFAALVAWPFRGKIRRLTQELRQLSADLATLVVEIITGIRTVRSYGCEKRETLRFVAKGHELVRKNLRFQLTHSFASGLPRTFVVVASVTVYIVGGGKVIRGEMELGSLIAMGMYVGMVFAPMMSIVEYYLQLVQARVSLDRVREYRELAPEIFEDPEAPRPQPMRGAIRFEDVHFSFRPGQSVLAGVELEIAAGETVALVGPSAAGKSTLVDLLFRFLDPQSGVVSIDGQDLRSIRVRDLRGRMSVVSQQEHLFHTSLLENIRYGTRNASREDVMRVIEAAGIDEFLDQLDDGVDTIVGERGSKLSGGQRQRISIARALLRKPRILVLDEATSALDDESDRAIRSALSTAMLDATTLIITHRAESLSGVDRILTLRDGRIHES